METMTTTKWAELIATDTDGNQINLGEMVTSCPANLDGATVIDGAIQEWPGFFISAPGEEPDFDTPRGGVNWEGFAFHLAVARGEEPDAETSRLFDQRSL